MKNDYEDAIKSKLAELDLASKGCANFQARNLKSGQPVEVMDINDISIAYSKEDLVLEEFKLLLERAYPSPANHSALIQEFEERVEKAKLSLKKAEKRSL